MLFSLLVTKRVSLRFSMCLSQRFIYHGKTTTPDTATTTTEVELFGTVYEGDKTLTWNEEYGNKDSQDYKNLETNICKMVREALDDKYSVENCTLVKVVQITEPARHAAHRVARSAESYVQATTEVGLAGEEITEEKVKKVIQEAENDTGIRYGDDLTAKIEGNSATHLKLSVLAIVLTFAAQWIV